MPDSQRSEPGFGSLFLPFRRLGISFSPLTPQLTQLIINEYLAIDSGGHVSDLVVARNCCMARMLPGEAAFVSE